MRVGTNTSRCYLRVGTNTSRCLPEGLYIHFQMFTSGFEQFTSGFEQTPPDVTFGLVQTSPDVYLRVGTNTSRCLPEGWNKHLKMFI